METKKNTDFQKGKGYIFVAYHKPFEIIQEDFIIPIHAGQDYQKEDLGKKKEYEWLQGKMIGDNTGDNISKRNGELNECTVLYWFWKNLPIYDFKYVGLFQYRRQLILNDIFEKAKEDIEKMAYKCVHFKSVDDGFISKIGLTDDKISNLLSSYDCILPYECDLEALGIASPYEDWVRKIPGVHINDLVMLEEIMEKLHPELSEEFTDYLNSPRKRMYEMFIGKPLVINDYCEWLFDILFKLDAYIDTSLYSINGKRTLGYLAEILYGFYFSYMNRQKKLKIKECGVTFVEDN